MPVGAFFSELYLLRSLIVNLFIRVSTVSCALITLLLASFFSLNVSVAGETQSFDIPLVTVSGKDRALKDIVGEVARQSGYRIEISESLLSQKIGGEYIDTDLEVFFRRVLKGSDVFQVVDMRNKIIKILASVRTKGRVLVVEADSGGRGEDVWLDGEPNKTNRELLQARVEAYENYDQAEQTLDGESNKTTGDLLKERDEAFSSNDPATQFLDDESGKTTGDLLKERDEAFLSYDLAKQLLDGESNKTTGDLLKERDEAFSNYNPLKQPLDGELGKTFQDLLDERDRAFAKRTY